jgi:hypothetical protein
MGVILKKKLNLVYIKKWACYATKVKYKNDLMTMSHSYPPLHDPWAAGGRTGPPWLGHPLCTAAPNCIAMSPTNISSHERIKVAGNRPPCGGVTVEAVC